MFEAQGLTITINDEIKILELLKNSNGVDFKTIHIDSIPYYAILTKVRDFQKSGFTTNVDGTLDITDQGIAYLKQLLNSI